MKTTNNWRNEVNEIRARLEALKPRSCWDKGVKGFALDLLESYENICEYCENNGQPVPELNEETFKAMDTKTNIYKDQAVFTVTRWDGNGDVMTIYKGENETDARDLYKKEVAGAGTPVDIAGWTENDQAFKRMYHFEIARVEFDEDGDIANENVLEHSVFFENFEY